MFPSTLPFHDSTINQPSVSAYSNTTIFGPDSKPSSRAQHRPRTHTHLRHHHSYSHDGVGQPWLQQHRRHHHDRQPRDVDQRQELGRRHKHRRSRDARLPKVVRELTASGGTMNLLPSKPLESEKENERSSEDSCLEALPAGRSPRSLRDETGLEGRPPLIRQR